MMARLAPILFVLIWSSGFPVARLAVAHAAPQLILLARLSLTALLMAGAALVAGRAWPRGRRIGLHLLAGALLSGVYLCVSWWAIAQGMPAGIMSLLGALQPLAVAIGSRLFLGERLPPRGWAGLGVGLAGVALVLAPLLGAGLGVSLPIGVVVAAIASVLAMAAGTMIQSGPLARDDILSASAVQSVGATAVATAMLLLDGDYRWDNSSALWLSLGWSVLMLSAAAISLLVWMTRHQSPTRVSVLLLLVPPLAAVTAWLLFGERLSAMQLLGFALALGGVLIARSAARPAPEPA